MSVLEPLLNRVVLKQLKTPTNGGLIMAPGGQKSADRARVVAVGPGVLDNVTAKHIPCMLKVGDVVLINAYLGVRAKVDNVDVIIQKEEEVLCRELGGEFNGE